MTFGMHSCTMRQLLALLMKIALRTKRDATITSGLIIGYNENEGKQQISCVT